MEIIEEKWHIYDPESKGLKEINISEIPENPGYAFLRQTKKKGEHYHAKLLLFSPSGKVVQRRYIIGFSDLVKLNIESSAELRILSKMAHSLSTPIY